jgi:hypothetical protein
MNLPINKKPMKTFINDYLNNETLNYSSPESIYDLLCGCYKIFNEQYPQYIDNRFTKVSSGPLHIICQFCENVQLIRWCFNSGIFDLTTNCTLSEENNKQSQYGSPLYLLCTYCQDYSLIIEIIQLYASKQIPIGYSIHRSVVFRCRDLKSTPLIKWYISQGYLQTDVDGWGRPMNRRFIHDLCMEGRDPELLKWIFEEKPILSLECADLEGRKPIHFIFTSQLDEELLRISIDNTYDLINPTIMYTLCTHHPSKIDLIIYLATKVKPQWIDDYNNFINATGWGHPIVCEYRTDWLNFIHNNNLQNIYTKLFETKSIATIFVQSDYRFLQILPPHVKTVEICDIAYRNHPIEPCVQLIPPKIFAQIKKFGSQTKPALSNYNIE